MHQLLVSPPLGSRPSPQFWLLIAITATGTLAMHIFVPALPAAGIDLHASATEMQLTVSLFLAGLAFGQLAYGPLSDRFGRRPIVLLSLGIYTLGLAMSVPAPNVTALIAARILQALGACGSLVLGRAMVRDGSTGDDVVRRLSTLMIVMMATPMLAPALGGFISTALGWRAIFALLTICVGGLFVYVLLFLPETHHNRTALPGLGSVISGYGRLLRLPGYNGYVIAGSCCTTSVYAFLASAPFLFVDVLHSSASAVGIYCVIVVAGVMAGAGAARQFVSRLSIRNATRVGATICFIGALAFLVVDRAHLLSVPAVLAPMIVFAVGLGMASPNAVAGVMNAAPHAVGAASSFYGFAQMAFGALFTLIVAVWHDGSALPIAATLMGAAILAQIVLLRTGF